MRQFIFTVFALLLFTSTVQAVSFIQLGSGTVRPTEQLEMSLDDLIPGALYNVICNITDSNNAENKVILLFGQNRASSGTCSLNNEIISHYYSTNYSSNSQFQLTQVENIFEIDSIKKNSYYETGNYITFTNLDQDDSVIINCHATANTSGYSY